MRLPSIFDWLCPLIVLEFWCVRMVRNSTRMFRFSPSKPDTRKIQEYLGTLVTQAIP